MGDILNSRCEKCGLSPKNNANLQLYRFPKPGSRNVMRCETWAKFCYPDKPWYSLEFQKNIYSECRQLCDRHFNDCEYVDIRNRKLSKHAVPHSDENGYCSHNIKKNKPILELLEEPKVCRVCLALDVKMYDMRDFELSEMFQKITGIEITANNHSIMEHLCWECAARLKAAVSFRNKALLSDALLLGLVATGKRIHETDITSIKEKYENIKSNLSIHNVFNIAHIQENREEEEEQSSVSEKIDAEIVQNTLTEGSIKLEDKKEVIQEEKIETQITQNIITDTTTHLEVDSATMQNIDTLPEESIAFEVTKERMKEKNIKTKTIEYFKTDSTTYPEGKSATPQNIDTEIGRNTTPEEPMAFEDTKKGMKEENIDTEITEFTITDSTTYSEAEQSAIQQNIKTELEHSSLTEESIEFEDTKERIKEEYIETEIENDDEPMVYIPDKTEDMEVDNFNIKKEKKEDIFVDTIDKTGDVRNPTSVSGGKGNILIGYYHSISGETSVSTNGQERNIVIRPPPVTPIRDTIDYTCTSLVKICQKPPPMKVLLIVPQIISEKKESKNVDSSLRKKARDLISHDHTYMKVRPKYPVINIGPKSKRMNLFNLAGVSKNVLNRRPNNFFLNTPYFKKIVSAENVAQSPFI